MEFLGKKFKNKFKAVGDVLCLAGDICACGVKEDFDNFLEFLRYICPKYKYVLHVAGNHEYYTAGTKTINKANTMEGLDATFKKITKTIPNYIYLNCDVVTLTIGNRPYTFIGATLWADIKPADYKVVQQNMNDYNYIYVWRDKSARKITPEDVVQLHKKHVNFIAKACKATEKQSNVILITHHKPVADTPEKQRNVLTQAYETDITTKLSPSVKIAIHGHNHKHYNRLINGTKYVSNPCGYPFQRTGFAKDLTIKI
jgi:predicted phosphohydrolase